MISSPILTYVLLLNSCAEIWETIEKCLQSTNHAHIIWLKNDLHNILMQNKSMSQYLSKIMSKVDLVIASSSPISSEEIIYYTLHDFPQAYQGFKTAIHMNIQPLHLDDFYSLLYSEETYQDTKAAQLEAFTPTSLVTNPYYGRLSFK